MSSFIQFKYFDQKIIEKIALKTYNEEMAKTALTDFR